MRLHAVWIIIPKERKPKGKLDSHPRYFIRGSPQAVDAGRMMEAVPSTLTELRIWGGQGCQAEPWRIGSYAEKQPQISE